MGGDEHFVSWNNHKEALLEAVKCAHASNKYTDVTLVAGGRFFPAHRIILGGCSEYFQMVFSYEENQKPFIVLDQPARCIESLLNYIYLGAVQIPADEIDDLVRCAQFLKVRGLYMNEEDEDATPSSMSFNKPAPPLLPNPTDDTADNFREQLRLSLAHADYLGNKFSGKPIIPNSTMAPPASTTVPPITNPINFGVVNPFGLNVVANHLFNNAANVRNQMNAFNLKPVVDDKPSVPRKASPPTKRKRVNFAANETELRPGQKPLPNKVKIAKTARANLAARKSPVNSTFIPITTAEPLDASTSCTPINLTNNITKTTTLLLNTAIPSTSTTTTTTTAATAEELLRTLESQASLLNNTSITNAQQQELPLSAPAAPPTTTTAEPRFDAPHPATTEALNLMPQVKIEMDEDPDEQRQLDSVIDGPSSDALDCATLPAKTEPDDSDDQRLLVDDEAGGDDEGGHEGRSSSSSSSSSSQGTEQGSSIDQNGSSATWRLPSSPALAPLVELRASPSTGDTLSSLPQPLSLVVHCSSSAASSSPLEGASVYSSCGITAIPPDVDITASLKQEIAEGSTNAIDRNGHEADAFDEVKGRVITATTATVPVVPATVAGGVCNGEGGSLHMPPSAAAAIAGLPVACLPSAFSSLASSLGLGLCGATAGGGGSSQSPFGKISPVYASGATTGSRGGTPDIPHTNGGSSHSGSTVPNGNAATYGAAAGKQSSAPSYGNTNSSSVIMNNNDSNSINNNHLKFVSTLSPPNGVGDVKPLFTSTSGCGNSLSSSLSAALAATNLQQHHAGSQHSSAATNGGGTQTLSSLNSNTNGTTNGERQTYLCPLCGKQFGQPYNLRRHMSTHTGDRPFQCPHCEYAASQNVHLDKHIRRIHLNNSSDNCGTGTGTASVGGSSSISSTPSSPHRAHNGHHLLHNGGSHHTNGGGVTLNSSSGGGINIKGNGIAMNAGGGSNGILSGDPSARSPKTIVNAHWKFEPAAVTP